MISGLGSAHSANYAQYQSMMKQIDSDGDGSVTKAEFVDGAPQGVSPEGAASLFDLLDPQQTGSVKDGDLANAFQQLSAAAKYLLIQQQGGQQGAGGPDAANANGGPQDRVASLFAKLDTDGDGKLTRDEFVAGRPKNVSEADASKLFDQIAGTNGDLDGDGTADSLTEAQFSQGVEAQAAAKAGGHHHGGGGGGKEADEKKFDALDTNKDGFVSLEEFLAGRPENVSQDDATSLFNKLAGDDNGGELTKDQFVQGMDDERKQAQGNDPREMLKRLMASLQSQSTDQQGQSLDQLMTAINAYKTASAQGTAAAAVTAAAA